MRGIERDFGDGKEPELSYLSCEESILGSDRYFVDFFGLEKEAS